MKCNSLWNIICCCILLFTSRHSFLLIYIWSYSYIFPAYASQNISLIYTTWRVFLSWDSVFTLEFESQYYHTMSLCAIWLVNFCAIVTISSNMVYICHPCFRACQCKRNQGLCVTKFLLNSQELSSSS